MPRIGANDDFAILTEWLVEDGQWVSKQQELASLENTKAATELCSPADGYIHLKVCAGEEYQVDTLLAVIDETASVPESVMSAMSTVPVEEKPERGMTRKARELVEQYHIDRSLLPQNRLIREKDVLALISKPYSLAEVTSNQLLIYGTGGFAREIIEIIRQTNAYRPLCVINGIGDMEGGNEILGVPVVSGKELEHLFREGCTKAVNALAVEPAAFSRRSVYLALKKKNFDFPNIIHRSADISSGVRMGEGNLILAGAFIGAEACLGSDCIINAHAVISHQCIISDHCHIASGAVLAGGVVVGENTLIGQGCTIYQNVTIGKNVVLHNGCNVYKNVPDGSIVKANGVIV